MSVTVPRMMLMACLLSPSLSWSLGLGEIHLNSALNEPMNAEIDLIAAAPDELSALRATLAGRDAFTRYGIDKPPFLSSLTFKVGKGKDGRDALLVHSTDAIPEPFVTFLVEVNWARGRLMREYTVLLDPPVYTPGDSARSAAAVVAPSTTGATPAPMPSAGSSATTSSTAPSSSGSTRARRGSRGGAAAPAMGTSPPAEPASGDSGSAAGSGTYTVGKGDTLSKIARGLHAESSAAVDATMIALYRQNPSAFGGNINMLRQGSILRVPDADAIAALNQKEAMGEVHRQMDAWRSSGGGDATGHLRLVTPANGGTGSGTAATARAGGDSTSSSEAQALRDRVKDLEGQVTESRRLLELRNAELADLQRKLGTPPKTPATQPPAAMTPPAVVPVPVPTPAPAPPVAQQPAVTPPAPTPETTPPAAVTPVPAVVPPAVTKPNAAPTTVDSGSWIDWVAANWWLPAAILLALLAALGFAAMRKRKQEQLGDLSGMDATDVADFRDPTAKLAGQRKGNDSFVVEESGEHPQPDFGAEPGRFDALESKSPDDTMSSESAVNLDQGDPLAEADFHMAYGLYDQAADLVRIALEREPDRRDLRLKLLEIYFVWGNKDAFLQTAKGLESTRERAPAGEWDKIVIMGKQICPDEPMFAAAAGSGRGAGALVDLNLEGGENRVDIDLFGDPEGERSLDHPLAKESDDTAATGESPRLHEDSGLDFTLDAPERGADESPTREMAPRDEPTVESELMNFTDSPTQESPAMKTAEMRGRAVGKVGADQTAEVSLDDLGLDLDHLEETGSSDLDVPEFDQAEHPSDAPTMLAGLDEKSRRMMADAEKSSRDRDLTELERELEASFVADLDGHHEIKTAVLGPESAPTVLMPREIEDDNATSSFKSPEFSDVFDGDKLDMESTSKLRGIDADSIDLDLDRLASALGSGDTVEQPRSADEVFSTEVFEASQRNKKVDLDVGDAMDGELNGAAESTNKLQAQTNKLQAQTNKMRAVDLGVTELEPVTMSEVGTKLDLARAYMDMGDPEGARSILEEVVAEGSASQKQEASRLIESLPG